MVFKLSTTDVAHISASLSPARLSGYMALSHKDPATALKYHEWNSNLSKSLQVPLQSFELVLRNTLSSQLEIKYGANWFDHVNPDMDVYWQKQLQKIKFDLDKRHRLPYKAPDIIAQTTFGYWVALMDSKHDRTWWKFSLQNGFPNKSKQFSRAFVHRNATSLNLLRNRIAHHEPIHRRALEGDVSAILSIIEFICPTTAMWVDSQCELFRTLRRDGAPIVPPTVVRNFGDRWNLIDWSR